MYIAVFSNCSVIICNMFICWIFIFEFYTIAHLCIVFLFFFFNQNPEYEMRISDWSSDVGSSDLEPRRSGFLAALFDGAQCAGHEPAAADATRRRGISAQPRNFHRAARGRQAGGDVRLSWRASHQMAARPPPRHL